MNFPHELEVLIINSTNSRMIRMKLFNEPSEDSDKEILFFSSPSLTFELVDNSKDPIFEITQLKMSINFMNEISRLVLTQVSNLEMIIKGLLLILEKYFKCQFLFIFLFESGFDSEIASSFLFTPLNINKIPKIYLIKQLILEVIAEKRVLQYTENEDRYFCLPVVGHSDKPIGLIYVIKPDKFSDLRNLKLFSFIIGMAYYHSISFQKIMPSLEVTSEMLYSYMFPKTEDFNKTEKALLYLNGHNKIPKSFLKHNFKVWSCKQILLLKTCLISFLSLKFPKSLNVPISEIIFWLMTISNCYREVPYHCWRQAVSNLQMAIVILNENPIKVIFSEMEKLAILITCLCYYLDHRGLDNTTLTLIQDPLSQLYSKAYTEEHHKALCLKLLTIKKNNIFKKVEKEKITEFFDYIETCFITSTEKKILNNTSFYSEATNILKEKGEGSWSQRGRREPLLRIVINLSIHNGYIRKWSLHLNYVARKYKELINQNKTLANHGIKSEMDNFFDIPDQESNYIKLMIEKSALVLSNNSSPRLKKLMKNCSNNFLKWKKMQSKELKNFLKKYVHSDK